MQIITKKGRVEPLKETLKGASCVSSHLNEIIKRLGYANSPFLKYKINENYNAANLNIQTTKVLNILSPFATLIANNEPFILFFDEPLNRDEQKDIHKKVWNAQVPVAIFCSTTTIKIFCGYTIDTNTHLLFNEIEPLSVNTIDESSPFSFLEITSQNFWKNYEKSFRGNRLSQELLSNLTFLTDKLKNIHKISFATKLTLRLIFIRYLIDREVDINYQGFSSDTEKSQEAFLALLDNKSKLYALFDHLKGRFNGNLFEIENGELDSITEASLGDVHDFLSARIQTQTRQLSLFNLYDFAIIPVELISSIFEILIGEKDRKKDNAFYTPKYLTNYILDMTIDEHLKGNDTCKVLDPSCGSGIFLVDSYRRMVEKKLGGKQYTDDDKMLHNVLVNNIFGVDLNPTAIEVAIFSLYLAMLDYKNPRNLERFSLPNLKGSNLIESDFFDVKRLARLQENVAFDYILGNPPWGSANGMHIEYCKNNGYKKYMQNKDTCRAFILRSKDFCEKNKNTTCCFVLHSKKTLRLQSSQSKAFREFLITKTKINRLIEMSPVRRLVFEKARAPAIILSYCFSDENVLENRFEHITMKKNMFFHMFNIIAVEKTDVKSVQQRLLFENDWAWKTLVYGLAGDLDNILRCKAHFPTLGATLASQTPPLIEGTGVKYGKSATKDASHLFGKNILDSNTAIGHFKLNENSIRPFAMSEVESPRREDLFCAPYCLSMEGLDIAGGCTMRAVYSEEDFVFKNSVHAIKGTLAQKEILLNIAGLLNSKIYAYFNLMLGSALGIAREVRYIDEMLSFPFVKSSDIARQVEYIQELKKPNNDFNAQNDASAEVEALNRTIFDAFGLLKNEFVDYALQIQIPQLTGKKCSDAIRDVEMQDLELYAKYFYDYLCPIFESSGTYVHVSIYPEVARYYSAIEVTILDHTPDAWLTVNNRPDCLKEILTKLSTHKANDLFYVLKDILEFEENSFFIIKSNSYKNWHPAIARLDIMEVTDQILSRETGGDN